MKTVLVVCGATASGKTSLAVECAEKLHTEIVSADSLLVYKGLDVGTAKPTEEEKRGIKHHLIDVVSPKESFSVSDYERLALPVVERLLAEDKTPIICGGTGFYVNSLLYKSGFGGAGADEGVRADLNAVLEEKGKEFLHGWLQSVDPESAAVLHPNDAKRVMRALEIFLVTGKKKSQQADERIPRFPFLCVSVDFPRERLYERINLRVDQMFSGGLLEEVQGLLKSGVDERCQCMQGIGYKEVAEGLRLGQSLEEIAETIKKNTRNYAKRQLTFFKRMENHVLLAPERANAQNVLELLKNQ